VYEALELDDERALEASGRELGVELAAVPQQLRSHVPLQRIVAAAQPDNRVGAPSTCSGPWLTPPRVDGVLARDQNLKVEGQIEQRHQLRARVRARAAEAQAKLVSALALAAGLEREPVGARPLAARDRGVNHKHRIVDADRSYYSDAEGWVAAALRSAVGAVRGAPCAGEAMTNMRFLSYMEPGGGLPPHVDLSRTRRDGRVSSCTFILYLNDCGAGGETVLLERLEQPSAVRAAVTPRRGRLLLFPHLCPHLAAEAVAGGLPKVLLRGEML